MPVREICVGIRLRQTGLLLRELEALAWTLHAAFHCGKFYFAEDRKKAAVQNEDYDAAKALKSEIDRLRSWTAVWPEFGNCSPSTGPCQVVQSSGQRYGPSDHIPEGIVALPLLCLAKHC